jgi:hypothetical protein
MSRAEIRAAILSGAPIELIPDDAKGGWYARIGWLSETVEGRTAAEALLKCVDILTGAWIPEEEGQ